MKRILLIAMLCLTAWNVQAQRGSDYHPFVEKGKKWCIHGFSINNAHSTIYYSFGWDEEIIDGRAYLKLSYVWDKGKYEQWLREEDQRVYLYDKEAEKEYKIYDFSLNTGDEFEPEYGDLCHCKVKRVGTIVTNGEYLKTITFEASLRGTDGTERVEAEWVEGIGHRSLPLAGLYDEAVSSWNYYTAYVLYPTAPTCYLSFAFDDPSSGWHGQNLVRGERVNDDNCQEDLTYEIIPDPANDSYALHIYGNMRIQCGPINYIYCICDENHRFTLVKEAPHDEVDCVSLYPVNLFFPFVNPLFNPLIQYTVADEQGERPVPVNYQASTYHPFIEEGKVWKVGWFPALSNTAKKVDYYYFEGDTIINDRLCRKLECRHEAAEDYGSDTPWTEYVGALYEEGLRVYCAFPQRKTHELLYDFESAVGDTVSIHGGSCIIAERGRRQEAYFKGNYTAMALYQTFYDWTTDELRSDYYFDEPNIWYEGVGFVNGPLDNCREAEVAGNYYDLMTCSVGDEVIYRNPNPYRVIQEVQDGNEVKKQWLDFTHTVKTRPKAPARYSMNSADKDEEACITGEYSDLNLFVNLQILTGLYTITLQDKADTEVYHKEVQTSVAVALNTDLSQLPEGDYTLTIENAEECYSASLKLPIDVNAIRDIPATLNAKHSTLNYYDLSGRRISVPSASSASSVLPPGVYIKDGKKVVAQ